MKKQVGPVWNLCIKPLVMALLCFSLFYFMKADFIFAVVRPVIVRIGLKDMSMQTYYFLISAVSFFLPALYCTKWAYRSLKPVRMIKATVAVLLMTAVYSVLCSLILSFATGIENATFVEHALQYLLSAVIFVPMNYAYNKHLSAKTK